MPNIEWVVETGEIFLDGRDLANAIEARGGKVHRVYGRAPIMAWPNVEGVPLGFGSCNFIMGMSREKILCEGVLDYHQQLKCSNYYHDVYDMILGPRVFMPNGCLGHSAKEIEKMFGPKVFVRPDAAVKEFDGQVFSIEELAKAGTDIRLSRNSRGMVVLGKVFEFDKEYRVFCRNGKAFCHSSYIPLDKEWEPAPRDVLDLAEEAALRLYESVGSMIVVDVGRGKQGLSLIEINGVNSSGFYGSDLNAFIEAMEAEVLARQF